MKPKIYPSVMAKDQKELNTLFQKLEGVSSQLHLDVADGKFVSNTSLWFKFRLSRKFSYNAHLMLKNPDNWIKKHAHKVQTIIFHPESVRDVKKTIELIRSKKRQVGLALKPTTKYSNVKQYLHLVDYVLVLTVRPGFYGAKFLKSPLKKIKQVKQANQQLKVFVDGGMDPNTVPLAVIAGADYIVSGHFISKANNSKKAMRELRAMIR